MTSGLAVVLLIAFYLIYSTVTSSQKIAAHAHAPRRHAHLGHGPVAHRDGLAHAGLDAAADARPQPAPGGPQRDGGPGAVARRHPAAGRGADAGAEPVAHARPPAGGRPDARRCPSGTPAAGTVTVEILIQQPVWFRVFVDDVKVFEGTLPKGTVRSWTGTRTVQIRTGRADIVHIKVNGQDRGLLGSPQQTVVTKQWDVNGNEKIVQ